MHYYNSIANPRRCRGIKVMLRKRPSNVSESSSVCQLFKTHNLYIIATNSLLSFRGKVEGSAVEWFSGSFSPTSTSPYCKLEKTGMQYDASCIDASEQGCYIQSPPKLTDGSQSFSRFLISPSYSQFPDFLNCSIHLLLVPAGFQY